MSTVLRHVAPPRPMRLVQEEIAIAGCAFCILIDGDDDRLDVLIAPALSGGEAARLLYSVSQS